VAQYQQEFRGLAEYYQLAFNLHRLNRLKWVMEQSLVKTLACKLRTSASQVYKRYRTTLQTDAGPRVGLQVRVARGEGKQPLIANWGGITLQRRTAAVLNDAPLLSAAASPSSFPSDIRGATICRPNPCQHMNVIS
jgi:hypothetical protein